MERPSLGAAGLAVLLLLLMAAWSAWQIQPPRPLDADAHSTMFAAERAQVHLEAMGHEPRIPGNAYHAAARSYMVEYLTALGLEVDVQWSTIILPDRRQVPFRAARIANIAARLPGTNPSGAVLMAAHYDSVPSGPGVGDDLVGVAALLETARALTSGEPLRNDIIFLITDAHEYGLFGARAFAQEHPWMHDARLMFNFEGQGPTGPVYMFESTTPNADLIRHWARAVPHPMGDSISLALYEQLNFDNDFRIFADTGLPGLGFASLADMAYYHSELDHLDRLNLRTVQHQGSNVLGLAAYFGQQDLAADLGGGNAVYFNAGPWLVRYPDSWARPLAAAVALAASLLMFMALEQAQLRWGALITVIGITGVAWAVGVAAAWAASQWLELSAATYRGALYYTSFLLQTAVFWWWAAALLQRQQTRYLLTAAVFWTATGALALALLLPEGSHLLTWPSVFACTALLVVLGIGRAGGEALHRAAGLILVLPGVLLLARLIWLLFTVMTPAFPLPGAAVAGLCFLLLLPLVQIAAHALRIRWSILLLLVSFALWALPGLLGSNADHPQRYTLFFVEDTAAERSYWATDRPTVHPWLTEFVDDDSSGQVLRTVLPFYGRFFVSEAEPLDLPPFLVTAEESDGPEGERLWTLRLASQRQAHTFLIYVDPGTHILGSALNGQLVTGQFQPDWTWALQCIGVGDQPLTLEFAVPQGQALGLTIVEQSHDAPKRARPPELMADNHWPYLSGSVFTNRYIYLD